ncbi:hypothetical protein IscW_ISCW000046 [Ixodes scapularis]|uniref:Uncharacterized protein n=1 Tax=Ixodes scapularis TaxID=6945 RepID=B7P532_IXOSC|nr:hypothetical protein IscW_ISCW000046 [Ixodes scapularis]|eukprot:XP_002406882.1 hypothetical protein IscW_ISCW000046 [Ixodes scapularis]
MKLLMPIMSACADVTVQVIDASAQTGEAVDVTKLSKGLSMDVITKCALAWQYNADHVAKANIPESSVTLVWVSKHRGPLATS